jgi:hypothetical protein
MKKIFIFSLFFIISCQNNDGFDNDCLNEKVNINNKIKGGSILQTHYFSDFLLPEYEIKTTDLAQIVSANWVSLSPIVGLDDGGGPAVGNPYSFLPSQQTDKMRVIIPKMKNSGLQNIMLKPLTVFWIVDGSSFWSDFYVTTETEWRKVEIAYEELIYEFAKLSIEFPEVKILSIGNELREFTKRRPQFFKNLIARIRADFPALKLTYAANWDEYNNVTFWGDLDYIGVNPYFSLVNKKTASVEEIERAFNPLKSKLKNMSCTYQKPILFTEYGFRSMDYATWKPWLLGNVLLDYKVNFKVQENAYTAFYNTFWEQSWVAGGFFWEWDVLAIGETNNPDNNGWYVRDKPVEKIIRERYSR